MEKNQNKLKINYRVWYFHNEYEKIMAYSQGLVPILEKNLKLLSETWYQFLHPEEMCSLESFTDPFWISKPKGWGGNTALNSASSRMTGPASYEAVKNRTEQKHLYFFFFPFPLLEKRLCHLKRASKCSAVNDQATCQGLWRGFSILIIWSTNIKFHFWSSKYIWFTR